MHTQKKNTGIIKKMVQLELKPQKNGKSQTINRKIRRISKELRYPKCIPTSLILMIAVLKRDVGRESKLIHPN